MIAIFPTAHLPGQPVPRHCDAAMLATGLDWTVMEMEWLASDWPGDAGCSDLYSSRARVYLHPNQGVGWRWSGVVRGRTAITAGGHRSTGDRWQLQGVSALPTRERHSRA